MLRLHLVGYNDMFAYIYTTLHNAFKVNTLRSSLYNSLTVQSRFEKRAAFPPVNNEQA